MIAIICSISEITHALKSERVISFYRFGPWFGPKILSGQAVSSMNEALPGSTWLLCVGRGKLSDIRNLAISPCYLSHAC